MITIRYIKKVVFNKTHRLMICIGGEIMNLITKVLNSAALASAKNSENTCPVIGYDEPKMPASMIK